MRLRKLKQPEPQAFKGFNRLRRGNVRFGHEEFNIKIYQDFLAEEVSIKGSFHSNNEDRLVFKVSKDVGYAFAIDGISKGGLGASSSSKWKDVIEGISVNPYGKKAVKIVKEFRKEILKALKRPEEELIILENAVLSGVVFFKEGDEWRYIFIYGGDGGFAIVGDRVISPLAEGVERMPVDIRKHVLPNGNLVHPLLLDESFKIKHCSLLGPGDFITEPFPMPIPSFVPVFAFRRKWFDPLIVYTDGITEAYLGYAGRFSPDSYARFMKALVSGEISVDELKKHAKKFRETRGISGWDDISYLVVKKSSE